MSTREKSDLQAPLWQPTPDQIVRTQLHAFMQRVNANYGRQLQTYGELYHWSIENIPQFWAEFFDYAQLMYSGDAQPVVDDVFKMPGARWFPEVRINFAENLLRHNSQDLALIFRGEDRVRAQYSYAQLYDTTSQIIRAYQDAGLRSGDRVAAFMPNMPETIMGMLAATAMGAAWSSCSPDFGVQGVLDRFGQIEPTILIAAESYCFKGKVIDCREKIRSIVSQLPSLKKVILVPYAESEVRLKFDNSVAFPEILERYQPTPIEFARLPFDHPVYIMYSSGTTGLPKCMVQGPGVLLNHLKELMLHTDLRAGERIFYFTTCGWMMWNWLSSALATGATLVLYDGNPFHPGPDALWQMADELGLHVFGTSAKYLDALEQSETRPAAHFHLKQLRAILSTGSPLAPEGFDFVYRDIKSDVQLSSISGGTDLNGCFALGNPILPVYRGEIQCRGLGMKVEIYDDHGAPIRQQKGELVCSAAFPSMPLYFWKDEQGTRYRDSYFDVFPGVWRHGDFAELTAHDGMVIYGRSDATLNPGGVRIGTADIYRVVEDFSEVVDSVVVGQQWQSDVRVVLFVQLEPDVKLNEDLRQQIRARIKSEVSPRHVPAVILAVPAIPYTRNMKKVEIAVRKMIHNEPITNREALANPESLDAFRDIPDLHV
ncbi:MAG: acetoacetate--CoA ligase [Leptospiraceae bacterium]|nr:acetoacetate--CoA ligase [Leptospiraceae bacterium]MCB1320375.1 acetoacetate--CoA ligase [Leptospiraceae bacterium]